MSLVIFQRPNQNGIWVAAKNPVIYKMTRADFLWTSLTNSGGNTSIHIATDVTVSFVAGDVIMLRGGVYAETSGTVISSAFGADTTVITSVPYTANETSGYINIISRRPNYYAGIGVYKSTDNTLIGTVNYYPNTIGFIVIDIQQPLWSILDPSISSISNGIILQDTNTTTGFYIKYTEFWTGSAESPVDDVANISYAIYGAKQIGQDSYYAAYTNLLALTKLDSLRLYIGEYYALSYIWDGNGGTNYIKKSWYDPSGNLLLTTYISNTNASASIYTFIEKLSLTSQSISLILNFAAGGTIPWVTNTLTIATGTQSYARCSKSFNPSGRRLYYTYGFTTDRTITVGFVFLNSSGVLINGQGNVFAAGTYTQNDSLIPILDSTFVGLYFSNSSGANATMTINSLLLSTNLIGSTIGRIDYQGVNLSNVSPYMETIMFTTISGYVQTCNKNLVTLFWRNKLGGESSWTFNFNQEQVQKLQDPNINIWKNVYDESLTLAQFNALNELFGVGQVYQTPLIELTTAIDKTEARVGQQVYIVDSNGIKTGVIVIGSENKTQTKRNKHNFQATIELSEIFG